MCGSVNKYVLEELLTEYEQNTEINNNTEDEAYQQYAWELGNSPLPLPYLRFLQHYVYS